MVKVVTDDLARTQRGRERFIGLLWTVFGILRMYGRREPVLLSLVLVKLPWHLERGGCGWLIGRKRSDGPGFLVLEEPLHDERSCLCSSALDPYRICVGTKPKLPRTGEARIQSLSLAQHSTDAPTGDVMRKDG